MIDNLQLLNLVRTARRENKSFEWFLEQLETFVLYSNYPECEQCQELVEHIDGAGICPHCKEHR